MQPSSSVFSQITRVLYPSEFSRCVKQFPTQRPPRGISSYDQFLALCFGQLTYRESLRDIVACLQAKGESLYHLGWGCKSLSVNWSWGISSSNPFRGRRSEGERSEPNVGAPGRGCDARFASLVAGHAGLLVVATKHSNTQILHDPPERL